MDSRTGRVHVFCNDQVSFLLRNADKFIRPLQAKGIKVNMIVLGNHDEAGMGNLSQAAEADFAKELKAFVDYLWVWTALILMTSIQFTKRIRVRASSNVPVRITVA